MRRLDKRASIAIPAVFFISAMLAIGALLLEASHLYFLKLQSQRTADFAVLAAALTVSPTNGTTASAGAIATAQNVANINGFGSPDTTTTTVPVASTLSTTIALEAPITIGQFVGASPTVPVASNAEAKVKTSSGICLESTQEYVAIYESGTNLIGPNCSFDAETYVTIYDSATADLAKIMTGDSTATEQSEIYGATVTNSGGITGNATITDPLASSPSIQAIQSVLSSMASTTLPVFANEIVSGSTTEATLANTSSTAGTTALTAGNGTNMIVSSNHFTSFTASGTTSQPTTVTFPGSGAADPTCQTATTIAGDANLTGNVTVVLNSGCYVIGGGLNIAAGSNVIFQDAVSNGIEASVVLIIKGTLTTNTTSSLKVGDATVILSGTVANNPSDTISFGNGAMYIAGSVSNGSNATMTFGSGQNPVGPYYIAGTIHNANNNSTLTMGNGPVYVWGSLSNTGLMEVGNGPFYYYGGTLYTNAGATTVFGTGNTYFYGGSAALTGTYTTIGCLSETVSLSSAPTGCNDGSLTSSGSEADAAAASGEGTIYMQGGTYSLVGSGALDAIGETLALNGGTVNLEGTGTYMVTAPTNASPSAGYRNIMIYIYSGALNAYQTGTAPYDVVSGIIYDEAASLSIYGSQTMSYQNVPNGCFGVVTGGSLNIYEGVTAYLAPCLGITASSRGALSQ